MIEDINFGKEIALGLFIGFLFIVANAFLGFVIGIPLFSFSSETERYAVVGIVAPLGEELAFRAFLPFVLALIGFPFFLNAIVNVALFMLYHFAAYGSSFSSASALFLGASMFALVAFLATYYDSDADEFQIPIAAIIGHLIANFWLLAKQAAFIVVGAG